MVCSTMKFMNLKERLMRSSGVISSRLACFSTEFRQVSGSVNRATASIRKRSPTARKRFAEASSDKGGSCTATPAESRRNVSGLPTLNRCILACSSASIPCRAYLLRDCFMSIALSSVCSSSTIGNGRLMVGFRDIVL